MSTVAPGSMCPRRGRTITLSNEIEFSEVFGGLTRKTARTFHKFPLQEVFTSELVFMKRVNRLENFPI